MPRPPPEATLLASGLTPPLQLRAALLPSPDVVGGQFQSLLRPQPSRHAGYHPHRPRNHQASRGTLAAAGPPLVIAMAAEQVLQVVVGPRQLLGPIAPEQSGPVTFGHLDEVTQLLPQGRRPRLRRGLTHPAQDLRQPPP